MNHGTADHGGGPLAVLAGRPCPGAGECFNPARLCATFSGAWQHRQALILIGLSFCQAKRRVSRRWRSSKIKVWGSFNASRVTARLQQIISDPLTLTEPSAASRRSRLGSIYSGNTLISISPGLSNKRLRSRLRFAARDLALFVRHRRPQTPKANLR